MSHNFLYDPLPDNRSYFRLLELLPGIGHDPLRCRLRIEKISAHPNPTYEAISYVWRVLNDDRDLAAIQCDNGHTVGITWNLQTALTSLRHEKTSRLVWADAVCINQDDLEERKEQVQCMRDVFANASKVLVWLGNSTMLSFRAPDLFAFLDQIAALCPAPKKYGLEDDFAQLDQYLKEAEPRHWEMLRELLQCTLFRRIWVVQELSLAADGYLLVGKHGLSLVNFKIAMFWIRKRRPIEVRRFKIPWANLDPFLYLRFIAGDISRPPASITGSSGRQPVYFVLRSTRSCLSTNPRDMIYALLGHCSLEKWTKSTPGYTQVPVDYKIPYTELYFAVACRLFEESQPLFTLSLVEHGELSWNEKQHVCPSWVPRWEVGRGNYILADEYRDRYEKSRSKPPALKICDRILEVEGCVIDTVIWRSQTMTLESFRAGLPGFPGQGAANTIRQTWEYLREMALSTTTSSAEREEEKLLEDFCLTLNAGCRVLSKQTYRDDVTTEQRVSDCFSVLSELGAPVLHNASIQTRHREGDWDRFLATAQDVCQGRCFFRTARGLIGIGPRVAAVGDQACIFFGAQVPFLLNLPSHSVEEYRFCGECYLHDMMNGQAIDALDEGKLKKMLFKLV